MNLKSKLGQSLLNGSPLILKNLFCERQNCSLEDYNYTTFSSVTIQLSLTKKINVLCLKIVLLCFIIMSKVRIIGDMMKHNCSYVKNNRQDVQEYKNRIIGQKKRITYQGLSSTPLMQTGLSTPVNHTSISLLLTLIFDDLHIQ